MKLGVIGNWNNEEFLRFAKGIGIEYLEGCMNVGTEGSTVLANAPKMKENLDRFGMKWACLGRWGEVRIDDDGNVIPAAFENDKRIIDATAAIGATVFNCGCNFAAKKSFSENIDIATSYFASLIEYAKPKGVRIAVYNCSWANACYDERTWRIILARLPELGLKYDTSHCVSRGGDYLREMNEFGDRFYHFHLKDSLYIDGKHIDDPPIGLGTTNWGAVMNLLYAKNYKGILSIEPHSPNNWIGNKGLWGIEFSAKYISPYIMPEDYNPGFSKEYKPW